MFRLHACELGGDGFVVGMIQGDGDRLAPCPNDPEPSPQTILIISRLVPASDEFLNYAAAAAAASSK
jgi:hypothetical protein